MKWIKGYTVVGILIVSLYIILYTVGFIPSEFPSPISVIELAFIIFLFPCLMTWGESGSREDTESILRSKRRGFKDSFISEYQRIVRNDVDGEDYIVNGAASTTFREACLENWQFLYVKRKSSWFVKDDKGNDISEVPLSVYGGKAILVSEYVTESYRGSTDETADYSDSNESVEYYD